MPNIRDEVSLSALALMGNVTDSPHQHPGLRQNQYRDKLFKQFEKAPENRQSPSSPVQIQLLIVVFCSLQPSAGLVQCLEGGKGRGAQEGDGRQRGKVQGRIVDYVKIRSHCNLEASCQCIAVFASSKIFPCGMIACATKELGESA